MTISRTAGGPRGAAGAAAPAVAAPSCFVARLTTLLVALASPAAALAMDFTGTLRHTAEYTDNTARQPSDPVDEWIQRPGASVTLEQRGAALEIDAAYDWDRRIYQRNVFQDEDSVNGEAELLWKLVPERLEFVARNVRTQVTIQALQAVTEDNRQDFDTTELGPRLRLAPRPGDALEIEYLVGRIDAEDTDTDSERQTLRASYRIGLSAVRTLSVNVIESRVDFENELAEDIDGRTATLALSLAEGPTTYDVEAGYTRLERGDGTDVDGFVFDLQATRALVGNAELRLLANRAITDRSTNLDGGTTPQFFDTLVDNSDLNEVATQWRARATIGTRLRNNDVAFSVLAEDQDFDRVPRDLARQGIELELSRELSRTVSATLRGQLVELELTEQDQEFDELRAEFGVRHRLGRRLALAWGARYEDRQGDSAELSFDAWNGFITLEWALFGPPPDR